MDLSDLTARQMYEALKAASPRRRFGFGDRIALVNVDLQCAYTAVDTFATAYETDPRQLEHVAAVRVAGLPVVWTYVAYAPGGGDCGVWGTRNDTPDSLQNIREGSPRAALDPRLEIDPGDTVMRKRMPSAFFETHLASLLVWHRIDTVVVTGGRPRDASAPPSSTACHTATG